MEWLKLRVYLFDEGNAHLKNLLGGKGANLAELTNMGLLVPPGIIITTETCKEFFEKHNGQVLPGGLMSEIKEKLQIVEERIGRNFGDPQNPLLVSVRSGAPVSMPGMMDTVLNLGINDDTVQGLIKSSDDARFAYTCYSRFLQMFGKVVLRIKGEEFDGILGEIIKTGNKTISDELTVEDLTGLVHRYKQLIVEKTGKPYPTSPWKQLELAIKAVFQSWNIPRALVYRKANAIPDNLYTAVTIQSMVFGNLGNPAGTGVVFTRSPSTGEKELYGEYLENAQGEDVVAGVRTPKPIGALRDTAPKLYEQLRKYAKEIERHYTDMQDIEFTIENGRLFILQTRTGKRTIHSAVKIAVDMVEEGLIRKKSALMRIDPSQLSHLLHPTIDPRFLKESIAKGLPASPGAASGAVVFDIDEAVALSEHRDVILVRPETTPEDIRGMIAAKAILTRRGGMTSHAAVVARSMGKPAIVGCDAVTIDLEAEKFSVGNLEIQKGEPITIDGTTGSVILGKTPVIERKISVELDRLLTWADEHRSLGIRANADTPEAATKAKMFGAEGIGLCRTERMFNLPERLHLVQGMILARVDRREKIKEYLKKLLPMQKSDFKEIFKVMNGYPVTIRLLDLPLHEFLPNLDELIEQVTRLKFLGEKELLAEKQRLLKHVLQLVEHNPMLGHRGSRLGISYPEIYEMQTRAIFEAAAELVQEGSKVTLEIMLPLVGIAKELAILRDVVERTAKKVLTETEVVIEYLIGTMIEVPRAVITADEIVENADFFSFGTNDLTQTTFGFSRDDAETKFLHEYLENNILRSNPFEVLDEKGVGKLIEIAVNLGRSKKRNLKIGVCGEHGGDPNSINFFHKIGINYVSCSPYRVPIARIAAAQIKITELTDT